MISDRSQISKPWTQIPDRRNKLAYFLTYAVVLIGLAGGIVQCYFNYAHAQLDKTPLCLVMEENFDSEDAVFGPNGSFNREINMDGFGYVLGFLSPQVNDPEKQTVSKLLTFRYSPVQILLLTRVF
jgi:hypothetical protein